jgi:uncharacterized protein (TIGR02284 family)
MSTTSKSVGSILNGLIETCRDGQEGFRSAAENVRRPDIKPIFSDLSMQRQYFAGELQRLALNLGEKVEKRGSVSAPLHRAWVDLKTVLTSGNDQAILENCEREEDNAMADYCQALEQDDLPITVRQVLQQQALGVKAAHDRVRDLCKHSS